jgi:enterochelin esterase-like enzyme
MKIQLKTIVLASAFLLGAVASTGCWYVFIAGAPQLDAPKPERYTGLHFKVETFASEAMAGDREYGVVLPPDYDRNPQKRYPVIVLLHGGHGTARDYEDKAMLTSVLHDLYQHRKLPPVIVITPDGNDQRGTSPLWDPDYFDGANGKVATLIGSDLVHTVRSRYRTLAQPTFWAIGGLSSGGWGAFNIGLRFLKQFHILFSHTGYFISKSGAENSPNFFVEEIPVGVRKQLRVYLDAGKDDEKFRDATKQFHETLDRLDIPNELHIYPGGHGIAGKNVGWNYWHQHLADSLGFVGKQFAIAFKTQQSSHKAPLSRPRSH